MEEVLNWLLATGAISSRARGHILCCEEENEDNGCRIDPGQRNQIVISRFMDAMREGTALAKLAARMDKKVQ